MSNLVTRILTAIVLGPLVLAGIFLGGYFLFAMVILISTIATFEFFTMGKAKSIHPNFLAGLIFSVLYPASFFFGEFPLTPFELAGFSVFLVALSELFRNKPNAMLNSGFTVFAPAYIGIGIGSFLGLRHLIAGPVFDSPLAWLCLSVIASIWMCDSFAYFGGRLLGKRKLFERVSPNKTWEGAISGLIASVLTSWVMGEYTPLSGLNLTTAELLILGLIPGIFGQAGDLVESLFKRDSAVKDSSHLIPGHGGMFDRFDSLLVTAPVVFAYINTII